jgi:hypothetical protein
MQEETTQIAAGGEVASEGQVTDTTQNQENTTQDSGSTENAAPKQWTAPTEAEWKQWQKDQAATQRRFNKRTAEMHAALRKADELEKRLSNLEKAPAKAQESTRPDPNDPKWKSHDEFVEALADWKLDQREAKRNEEAGQKAGEDKKAADDRQVIADRMSHVDKLDAKYSKEIPDFDKSFEDNADIFEALPDHVQRALLMAQDGSIAAYQLIQEGKLEALITMPEQFVVHEIVSAQHRGLEALKARKPKPTNAPAPMQPNKGTSLAKSENEMSGKELRKKHGLL